MLFFEEKTIKKAALEIVNVLADNQIPYAFISHVFDNAKEMAYEDTIKKIDIDPSL